MVNNGNVNGTVDVNFDSLATGTGTFTTVNVNPGGTYTPGVFGTGSPMANPASTTADIQPAAAGATTASSPVAVSADAVVMVNGTDSLTLSGGLNAAGHAVIKLGTGTLVVAPFSAASLNVSAGNVVLPSSATPLAVSTLLVAAGAKLDLTSDAADVTGGNLPAITALVTQGYNLPGGGNWAGGGITSSTAAANTSHLTAIGVIQNNQSGSPIYTAARPFDGVTPGAGDILVRYTYYGDANLDGKVDGSDYSLIDAGYASGGSKTGWYYGDFNYDGVVDGSDYSLIDNAFNNQSTPINSTALVATDTAQAASTPAVVPEPAALAVS